MIDDGILPPDGIATTIGIATPRAPAAAATTIGFTEPRAPAAIATTIGFTEPRAPAAAVTSIGGIEPRAPAAAVTMIGRTPTRPPAVLAPQAPPAAATLVGRPTDGKLPAKKPRTRPPGPPPKPTVPRPAPKGKPTPPDPVQARALLDAVLAAPADDAPRRAYGELLASHGDPRGDLILSALDGGDDAPSTTRWTKPLKALGKLARWRWERGFVHELRVTGWDTGCTAENLAAVLAAEPIVELAIDGGSADVLARLLAVPGIERVRRLAVSGWDPDEGGAFVGKVLAGATRLTGVTELRAGVKLGDAGVAALLRAKALGAVDHLAIGSAEASTATFAALAASPLGQRLEVLEWLRAEITAEMAQVIVTMPSLRTFVASTGETQAAHATLATRFRDRFVVEEEPGMQYLIDGVRGVSHRPRPHRS